MTSLAVFLLGAATGLVAAVGLLVAVVIVKAGDR